MFCRLPLLACTTLLLLGTVGWAQDDVPVDDWKPATTNQDGREYPQVNSEGRVRFRIHAPDAKSVACTFRDSSEFVKDADGNWTGYTRKLDEGFHYYELIIDGAKVPDPNSKYFFGAMRWGSGVEVPANDKEFYAVKKVPHGQIREVLFYSESTEQDRRAFIYTPPGYDADQQKRYPVLYLQHGWGENEYGWSVQGHAGLIMDNLIADGTSKPFIIVMTYGMTNDVRPGGIGGFDITHFETVLVDELIPYVDSHFRTLTDQPNRAMAGLSMGGMETKTITLRNLDKFSHIGLFSGGSISMEDVEKTEGFKEKVKLVFVSYGSKEVGGGGRPRRGGDPEANSKALKDAGINSHYYVSPETAHEWQTWRRSLREFAPLLFADDATIAKRTSLEKQMEENASEVVANDPNGDDAKKQTAVELSSQVDPNFHIYLCLGQSNMESGGRMNEADREVDDRFLVMADFDNADRGWEKNRWYQAIPPLAARGRGICMVDGFGKTLVAGLPENVRVGVVKVSVPGCKIELFDKNAFQSYIENERDWMKNIVRNYEDNPYQYLVDMGKTAQQHGVIKGVLLHQGESNTGDKAWPQKVKTVYDNLMADLNLNPEDVPLLAGEMVHADQQGRCASMNDILAELPSTIPNAHVISSAGCPTDDRLHFNSEGSRIFGSRYGEKMLALLGQQTASAN
ncbi:sialate O-acetylesterase [Stieleria varia]|uniref:Endo-1,4-beta-xylanase/feruloyl esterase n=1 Tax=Stieleria varia TaxID=2528005 RepID=A0A5C6B949_9BACT|nr:sialate O-acetylesterase [Stieleria varia]TWU08488.1 Endo-1,4-beta-xylanase/feruloyl esterase precursor [Stieleria varia]